MQEAGPVLAIIGDPHGAGMAAGDQAAELAYCLGLGIRALQKGQVAAKGLGHGIAGVPFEGFRDIDHPIAPIGRADDRRLSGHAFPCRVVQQVIGALVVGLLFIRFVHGHSGWLRPGGPAGSSVLYP